MIVEQQNDGSWAVAMDPGEVMVLITRASGELGVSQSTFFSAVIVAKGQQAGDAEVQP